MRGFSMSTNESNILFLIKRIQLYYYLKCKSYKYLHSFYCLVSL